MQTTSLKRESAANQVDELTVLCGNLLNRVGALLHLAETFSNRLASFCTLRKPSQTGWRAFAPCGNLLKLVGELSALANSLLQK